MDLEWEMNAAFVLLPKKSGRSFGGLLGLMETVKELFDRRGLSLDFSP